MGSRTAKEPLRSSRSLDDLIFHSGNPEWAKLTRFTHFRDVDPTHWSCSVPSSPESLGKILEVRLEGHARDTRPDLCPPVFFYDDCSRVTVTRNSFSTLSVRPDGRNHPDTPRTYHSHLDQWFPVESL